NQVGACALIKGAKHPEAAKVFLNFVLSKEAQELLSKEIKRRPARTDVTPPEGLAPTAELKLVRPDPLWVSQQKDQILDKFDEVRQQAGK
ncbi:MAG TPA: extracellular solute-binding protein, partial [Anaerolineae bacterium]|nr:extracellular solute-binding protein [Anaerolineae bacterium]